MTDANWTTEATIATESQTSTQTLPADSQGNLLHTQEPEQLPMTDLHAEQTATLDPIEETNTQLTTQTLPTDSQGNLVDFADLPKPYIPPPESQGPKPKTNNNKKPKRTHTRATRPRSKTSQICH